MEKDRGKGVSIELAGGLGNQLFTYIAGLYISSKINAKLKTVAHDSIFESLSSGNGIAALSGPLALMNRGLGGLRKSSWISKLQATVSATLNRLGLPRHFSQRLTSMYQSEVVGEDPGIDFVRDGYFVRGYFQTKTYFEKVRSDLPHDMFEIRDPSMWFRELRAESDRLKPINLHIRRGDYFDKKNSFIGALSSEYFLNGLGFLRQDPDMKDREVWVFSNDIQFVKQEFQGKIQSRVRWIEPPPESREAESLVLLGSGAALVISNSTFSWWAAVSGSPPKVVAPSKWFRAADDPENLLLPEWEKIESIWI
jgi:hypothetical protein